MGNGKVIGDGLQPPDARIVHGKVQQPGKDPLRSTAQVIDFLEFFATIGNLLTDIFSKYLSIGKTFGSLDKLRMHTEGRKDVPLGTSWNG